MVVTDSHRHLTRHRWLTVSWLPTACNRKQFDTAGTLALWLSASCGLCLSCGGDAPLRGLLAAYPLEVVDAADALHLAQLAVHRLGQRGRGARVQRLGVRAKQVGGCAVRETSRRTKCVSVARRTAGEGRNPSCPNLNVVM